MMNTANNVYELQIIKKAIHNHLDRTLPSDANKALYLIQYQIDDLVWSIATSIYCQSGYKVNFSLVREIANARVESLKILAVQQKALEEEAKRIEEARVAAEAETRRKAEEEKNKSIREQKYKTEKEFTKNEQKYQPSGINQEIFEKVKGIVVDQLEVEADRVTPEASFANDLHTDSLDMEELIMALEEEFDIESLEEDDFIKRRPLFSSAMEDEPVHSWVTVEYLVRLVQKKTFEYY